METPAPAPVAPTPTHPKFVRWAVVLGIVIVLNVFFTVIGALAFPAPQYDEYCPAASKGLMADTAESCTAQDGVWNAYPNPTGDLKTTGYCDFYQKCQEPWEAAQAAHGLRVFALMTVLGVLSLIAGVLPIGSSIVSSGLSFGGVLSLIIGSISYWSEAGNWLKLAISLVALVALLYIGLRRFRD